MILKTNTDDNRPNYLAYVNSILLTIITVISVMAFSSIKNVQLAQDNTNNKLIEVSTRQSAVVNELEKHDVRIKALELNYMTELRTWVENNFQKK